MTQSDDRFIAHEIDAQLEQLEHSIQQSGQQSIPQNARMIQELQQVYAAQALQEMHSLERVQNRLADHFVNKMTHSRHEIPFHSHSIEPFPAPHTPRIRRIGAFAQTLAAIIIVGALVGAFLVLLNSHRAGSGSPVTGQQPLIMDTSAIWCVVASPNRTGLSNNLNGAAAASTSDAWAVGSSVSTQGFNHTEIEHWNGSRWSIVASPPDTAGGSLSGGVAAISVDDAWAVGGFVKNDQGNPQALIEHWNGSQWSVVSSPSAGVASNLSGVTALAANDVWAVGWSADVNSPAERLQPLIEHWNGFQWSVIPSPSSGQPGSQLELNAVTAISARNIWAAGYADAPNQNTKTLIEHWNGSRWNIVPSPSPEQPRSTLLGVTATSAHDVWAVGDSATGGATNQVLYTLIEHWDGSRWSIVPSPNPGSTASILDGITAISPTNIWAVGGASSSKTYSTRTLIEHWNGSRWSVVSSPTPDTYGILLGVSRVPHSNTILAVGESSNDASHLSRTLTESTCK